PKTLNAIPRKPMTQDVNACGPRSPIRFSLTLEMKDARSARPTQRSRRTLRNLFGPNQSNGKFVCQRSAANPARHLGWGESLHTELKLELIRSALCECAR